MRQSVLFLHMPDDVFHAGKNFGKKLSPKAVQGLQIFYDKSEHEFEIVYNKRSQFVDRTGCRWELESGAVTEEVRNEHKPEILQGRKSAQVSGPHDHVFAGEGAGKVRDKK